MPEKLYEWILAIAVAIIAYFVKELITDIKAYAKKQQEIELEVIKCIDKIGNMESLTNQAMDAQKKLFEARMNTLEVSLNKIVSTLEETNKTLIHIDKNNAVSAKSFELIMALQDRFSELEKRVA